MNYEQRYKEALKRAKEQLECSKVCEYKNADVASGIMETVYNLFPELKESDDEGIRESIAGFLKTISSLKDGQTVSNEDFDTKVILEWVAWLKKQGKQSSNILWHDVSEEPEAQREIFCEWKSSTGIWHSVVFYHAYAKTFCEGERIIKNVLKWTYVNEMLEKQGAQKPVDKVEPKFKVGDWVVWQDKCYKVNYNGCGYELVDKNGLSTSLEYGTIDENAHLWDITKDAKDGDILYSPCHHIIWIYKNREQYHACVNTNYVRHYNFDINGFLGIPKDVFPATKEQSDILFTEIKEAGYEWNVDKKELIKL